MTNLCFVSQCCCLWCFGELVVGTKHLYHVSSETEAGWCGDSRGIPANHPDGFQAQRMWQGVCCTLSQPFCNLVKNSLDRNK